MEYQYKQDHDYTSVAFWGGVFVTLLAITFVFLTLHWWGHRGEHHHHDEPVATYQEGYINGKKSACHQFQQALDNHDIERTLPCMRIYWNYP